MALRALIKTLLGKSPCHAARLVCGEQARVEVIERIASTFEPLPKRWIVERTFGWLSRFRRLRKDYELYPEVSEAMIYSSLTRLMLERLASLRFTS
jgi:putative transposase